MLRSRTLLHCGGGAAVTAAVLYLQIRPFGIFFLVLLALWMYKWRCTAALKIVPPPQFTAKFLSFQNRVATLRKERPGIFCMIVSSMLAVLAFIGHLISGSSIVVFGLVAASLICSKYNFKILKVENKEAFIWPETPDHDDDEFLPEVNESNLFVLQRASDQAIVNSNQDEEDKSDEIPADLLIPDSIPEIEEHSDGSSDDELILKSTPSTGATAKLQNPETIEFKSGYFNKDSSISPSSSDDDSLSKGLSFQDYTVVDSKNRQAQTAQTQQASNLLPNLMAGLVSWNVGNQLMNLAKPPPSQPIDLTESSDESDFEILDTDDLNGP